MPRKSYRKQVVKMKEIIRLSPDDSRIEDAIHLAEEVFMAFEAPIYSQTGIDCFLGFIKGSTFREKLNNGTAVIYIYIDDGNICGMMSIRDASHICLAFVKSEYQRKGIGTALFKRISSDFPDTKFTVNAAPAGYEFYRSIGFIPTDMELIDDGITYTPMKII